jgi:hypothetical protein
MRPLLGLLALAILAAPSQAYIEVRYPLAKIVHESTNVLLIKVEKINKEKKLIHFKKVADLKGKHNGDEVRVNIGSGGFTPHEQKFPLEWAEVGKHALFFHNGGACVICLDKYWYQAYAGGAWWNHSHGEPHLVRSYYGNVEGARTAVEKLLKNEAVVVPAAVSKDDLRIHKYKTSLAKPDDYNIVSPPRVEKDPTK